MKQLTSKKWLLADLILLLLISCKLIAQSPGGVTNESLWLQGDFNRDSVRTGFLNFNPALSFDGNEKVLNIPHDLYDLRQATVLTVYQDNTGDKECPVWEIFGDFGNILLSTHKVSSQNGENKLDFSRKIVEAFNQENPKAFINTYNRRLGNYSNLSEGNYEPLLQLGSSNPSDLAHKFTGLIAEFILYEKILSKEELAMVETYLALKYGITLKKDYLNSSKDKLWDWENNIFSNNIAGIGRDDKSTLYQKQSSSSNEFGQLVIGLDKIAASNKENAGVLNDKDYLIWGDNSLDFKFDANFDFESDELIISDKKWLMKASGGTANKISTEIKIDISSLLHPTFPTEKFCMLIDRSAAEDFSSESSTLIMPESISPNGIATFNSIFWDTDRSGKDIFTFGLKPDATLATLVDIETEQIPTGPEIKSVQAFPNPTLDGHYTLIVFLNHTADLEIQVFDAFQRLISSEKRSGNSKYQISGFLNSGPGVYTILFLTQSDETSLKIIKE